MFLLSNCCQYIKVSNPNRTNTLIIKVYIHTYIHTCIHTYIQKQAYIHTYIHTYIHIQLSYPNRTSTPLELHLLNYTYMHACIHTLIHTTLIEPGLQIIKVYIHTYIHTLGPRIRLQYKLAVIAAEYHIGPQTEG